ncbi:MAG TPA: ribonuclease J [Patescibacteria group bacterium]|nr:ribonuclease J [Patescibacteria group bacterium]
MFRKSDSGKPGPKRFTKNSQNLIGNAIDRAVGQDKSPQRRPANAENLAAAPAAKQTISRGRLRVIPLGGVEEIGVNCTVLEYGDDIIVIDMGLAFPDETMPGVDYIIPDVKYLEDNKKKIRGMLVTHAHLDHIGAIPYVLPKIGDPPIYTMPLSAGLIKRRLEEFEMANRVKLNALKPDDVIQLGVFRIRFFRVNHNIPDCVGMSIQTPVGQIVYVTDWKFDHTPVDELPTEFNKIAKFGGEGVLMLCSDSTNAERPGYCISERELSKTIDNIFRDCQGRIVFATFSQLISRIQSVFDAAAKYNRKVIVTGRSMVNAIEIAMSMGYLRIQPKLIVKSEAAKKYPDDQVVILTTGAQGEEASALARMARGEHKTVRIKKGDTVVVSASPIPGNERSIVAVLDNLTREGAHVIYNQILDIHSSGHAKQEELKMMFSLTKPRHFMPIHGEHHMLVAHAKLAQTMNVKEENCHVMNDGEILEFDEAGKSHRTGEKVQAGYIFVDGLGVGDVGEVVLRDRQVMAKDGMFVIIITVDRRTGKLINQPDIISRGFIFMKNNDDMLREVKHEIRKMTETHSSKQNEANWSYLRQIVRDQIGEYLFLKTERRPMILPVIIEI